MYQKYFSPLVKYSIAYLFIPLFYSVTAALLSVVYAFFADIMPSLFPEYNQVLEKEKYLEFTKAFSIFAAFVTVFLLNFIMAINENARYERVVKRTDALYKIREELPRYLPDVIPADAIASSVPHLLFLALSLVKYPERLLGAAQSFLSIHVILADSLGFLLSAFLVATVAFAARILAAPFALRKYRGAWLTSFVDS